MEGLDVQERETEVDEFWMFVVRRKMSHNLL